MKIIVCVTLLFYVLLIYPSLLMVEAHGAGPSYLKINGLYTATNPFVNYTGKSQFVVGADITPALMYLKNEPINFEVDETILSNPYGQALQYQWGFGDKTELGSGRTISHTYTKPGTFFISLSVQYLDQSKYLLVDTIQINIVPYKGYELPKARIRVDNKRITDIQNDKIPFITNTSMMFDASFSTGTIKAYQWDFADGSGSKKKKEYHSFKEKDYTLLFPLLRVIDTNNIASDTGVFITHSSNISSPIKERKVTIVARLLQSINSFLVSIRP